MSNLYERPSYANYTYSVPYMFWYDYRKFCTEHELINIRDNVTQLELTALCKRHGINQEERSEDVYVLVTDLLCGQTAPHTERTPS